MIIDINALRFTKQNGISEGLAMRVALYARFSKIETQLEIDPEQAKWVKWISNSMRVANRTERRDRDSGRLGSDDPLRNRKGTKYYLRVKWAKKRSYSIQSKTD
jgi:hypothetical protein